MTKLALKKTEESTIINMAVIKGKFEFWINDPDAKKGSKPLTHIAVYNCHPHHLKRDAAFAYLRQVAEILPAYFEQFGGKIHLTLRADFAINGEAYHSEVRADYEQSQLGDIIDLLYDDLVVKTVEISKEPQEALI